MLKIWVVEAMLRVTAAAAISLLVAFGASAQTIRYVHTDGLGSVVLTTDKDRNIVERSEYEPYGSLLNRPMTDGPGYTGHVMDAATGLTYMQQRYYDQTCGCFLSVDPVAINGSGNWRQFNRYAYSYNNPYRFIDPDGRQSVGEMINLGAEGCGDFSCAGWAVLSATWQVFGAEGVSQIADKGWSQASSGDKFSATFEVLSALPPVRLVGSVAKESKPFALGLGEFLDDFAKARGADTYKNLADPNRWKSGVLEALGDPTRQVHFNLDGVDVWKGIQRASSGRGGATDWELLQIRQNPQSWDSLQFWKDGEITKNPFE